MAKVENKQILMKIQDLLIRKQRFGYFLRQGNDYWLNRFVNDKGSSDKINAYVAVGQYLKSLHNLGRNVQSIDKNYLGSIFLQLVLRDYRPARTENIMTNALSGELAGLIIEYDLSSDIGMELSYSLFYISPTGTYNFTFIGLETDTNIHLSSDEYFAFTLYASQIDYENDLHSENKVVSSYYKKLPSGGFTLSVTLPTNLNVTPNCFLSLDVYRKIDTSYVSQRSLFLISLSETPDMPIFDLIKNHPPVDISVPVLSWIEEEELFEWIELLPLDPPDTPILTLYSFLFNGVDNNIYIQENVPMRGNTNWSLSVFLKSTRGNRDIMSRGYGSDNANYEFRLYFASRNLELCVGGVNVRVYNNFVDTGWHHVAIVNRRISGVWTCTVYVDGIARVTFNGGTVQSNNNLIIGGRREADGSNTLERRYDGLLFDFYVTRAQLNEIQVNELYSPLNYVSPRDTSHFGNARIYFSVFGSLDTFPSLNDESEDNIEGTFSGADPDFGSLSTDIPV